MKWAVNVETSKQVATINFDQLASNISGLIVLTYQKSSTWWKPLLGRIRPHTYSNLANLAAFSQGLPFNSSDFFWSQWSLQIAQVV